MTNYALQCGIAKWIIGNDSSNNNVELLLNELDKWKLKTYEGKSVTFNFKICNDSKIEVKLNASDFLKFLETDFSAVLTDPTMSLFVLNSNCDLIDYSTVFRGKRKTDGYELCDNVPYRFTNVIYNEIDDNKTIGISLLSNGDIIISKERKIRFVKRGNKWLNFNGNALLSAIKSELGKVDDILIEEIFATALDVSFSHCGGIIACVDYNILEEKNEDNKILAEIDNLKNNIIVPNSKRKILDFLVNNKNFMDIDRKLRAELSALDGACILDLYGNVIAVGAIIQNKSGSTGGGRGAAAKRLSEFGGFAIKISTDGYLELYIDGNDPIYTIK